jgi:hypothetical protein
MYKFVAGSDAVRLHSSNFTQFLILFESSILAFSDEYSSVRSFPHLQVMTRADPGSKRYIIQICLRSWTVSTSVILQRKAEHCHKHLDSITLFVPRTPTFFIVVSRHVHISTEDLLKPLHLSVCTSEATRKLLKVLSRNEILGSFTGIY